MKSDYVKGSQVIPKQIIIEPTPRCNLQCKGCPATQNTWDVSLSAQKYIAPKFPLGDMDPALLRSIIDRVNFETVIIPWCNGEPRLHPEYAGLIRYITDKGIPCYITTNGTIWNEDLFQHITGNTSCYQIIFSIDGLFDPKSCSQLVARPGRDPEIIQETVGHFLHLKWEKQSRIDVGIQLCERGQDYEEIEEFIYTWLDTPGVDYVCVGKILVGENAPSMRVYPCQFIDHAFMVIRWEGTLVPCDYNDRMVNQLEWKLGRVEVDDTPLLELYNSKPFDTLRANQIIGRFLGPCGSCAFAYTGLGFSGVINFRHEKWRERAIYYHQDYYNQFFSLVKKWKSPDYYVR